MPIWKKKSPPQPKQPGKLIAIEGIDGVGKMTQLGLLAKTLTDHNFEGMIFEFPQYGPVSGELLKKYKAGSYEPMQPQGAAILYGIDRLDASAQIRQQLDQSKIVLAKRYVASNAAHQGSRILDRSERVNFYRWLDHLEYSIFNIPRPDLTVVLSAPVEILYSETPVSPEQLAHSENLVKSYIEVANLIPNTKLVDCTADGQMLSPAAIHTKVWELVRRIVLKNNSF